MSAIALFALQIIIGAMVIWGDLGQDVRALHLAVATAVWIVVSALVVITFSTPGTRWDGPNNG